MVVVVGSKLWKYKNFFFSGFIINLEFGVYIFLILSLDIWIYLYYTKENALVLLLTDVLLSVSWSPLPQLN